MLTDLNALHSEHILEIRYKPVATVLDVRGRLADAIAAATDLKMWNITANRVDFRISEDPNATERAFITHGNLGYVVWKPETNNYFSDRAGRFIREAIRSGHFALPSVTRFGVRVRALFPFDGSFQELLRQVANALNLDLKQLAPFDAEIVDIGPVIVLRRDNVRTKIQCGPMQREQAKTIMPGAAELPAVGLYVDIDQFQTDVGQLNETDVANRLRIWTRHYWEALESYEQKILTRAQTVR